MAKTIATNLRKRRVVPDRLDLRDRLYTPVVASPPAFELAPAHVLPVLDQRETSACTGFALATVIHQLLTTRSRSLKKKAAKPAKPELVSPYMLYSMARRYDEFPGYEQDEGSSLRGALKGWYRHGACSSELWDCMDMPKPVAEAAKDWWSDAARRPMGAYYRVDARSVTDMHSALNETGILYGSATTHDGWEEPVAAAGGEISLIEYDGKPAPDGGHAFAIVGYTRRGFIVHNSWGKKWGKGGLAILEYEDWLDNAMDCWVVQLGVPTELHEEVASSPSLRMSGDRVKIASDRVLRNRELSPFIVNLENNGRLSKSGAFRTQDSDLDALVQIHLPIARDLWKLGEREPIDVAIYAHGGLTGEETAADTADVWIRALYENHIFPIFLMWETDTLSTIRNRAQDLLHGVAAAGLRERLESWWDARIERLVRPVGKSLWDEMKQNAHAISHDVGRNDEEKSGALKLAEAFGRQRGLKDLVRFHLIGHSAGTIVHTYAAQKLVDDGWTVASVSFMAAAVRVDAFEKNLAPLLQNGSIGRFLSVHLTDDAEQKDPECRPILNYSKSLLYLVSGSFEEKTATPLLGLDKYFTTHVPPMHLPNVRIERSPGAHSSSTTHGGFDNDADTRQTVIDHIRHAAGQGGQIGVSIQPDSTLRPGARPSPAQEQGA